MMESEKYHIKSQTWEREEGGRRDGEKSWEVQVNDNFSSHYFLKVISIKIFSIMLMHFTDKSDSPR